MEQKQYLNEENLVRIISVFKDQKKKYNIKELPTSKIQGLTRINQYLLKETIYEMHKRKLIIKRNQGNREYWRLA